MPWILAWMWATELSGMPSVLSASRTSAAEADESTKGRSTAQKAPAAAIKKSGIALALSGSILE
eukprot:13809371-Alexandrium_andersonii.AAC.1